MTQCVFDFEEHQDKYMADYGKYLEQSIKTRCNESLFICIKNDG